MTTWFTADLHFGHLNIISYAARPFADVDEMNAALRDRWNDCVADDDEVWVLGEVHQTPVHLEVGGHHVLASHFPYHGDSLDTDRFVEHRPVDEGLWLLHGHVHSDWRQLDKMINVGVDVWRYQPVSEAALVELIEAGARHLSRLRA